MEDAVIRLKAELKTQTIILEDEDGIEKKYIIKELIGKQRNKYMNKFSSRLRISSQGKVLGMKNFDGMQSDLLEKCLYFENELVPQDQIEDFPSSVQQAMFEKAQELSGLGDQKESEDVDEDPND